MYSQQLSQLGIDLRGHYSGQIKTTCPVCSALRKKKTELCLSVNIDDGVYNCKNGDCNFRGNASGKIYTVPQPRTELDKEKAASIYGVFADRGLTSDTVDKFKITNSAEWMPQTEQTHRVICFNYFLDGQLINIKFKTKEKHFKMVKGARKIPYNIDATKEHDYVIIVEGEEECMVWDQCGYPSVISAPAGANKENNNLEWLDGVYSRLEGKTIYLATDNDEPGRGLAKDLARRFPQDLVKTITYPVKDANDTLKESGSAIFKTLFENATFMPIPEISEAHSYGETILYYRKHGYPKGFKVNMDETDQHLSWARKDLVIVTGVPGHGKTTWLDYMYNRLAYFHDWRTGIFSPEHDPSLKITRLVEQYYGKPINKLTDTQVNVGVSYVNDHFVFYDVGTITDFSIDHLLDLGNMIIRRYGVNSLVFDPFTYIVNDGAEGESSTEKIGSMLRKLQTYNKQKDVQTTLVAHPRKMDKDGGNENYKEPNLYDISGSNNFFNFADMGISIHRDITSNTSTAGVKKVKQHFRGKLGRIHYEFDSLTGIYNEVGSKGMALNIEYKETQDNKLL